MSPGSNGWPVTHPKGQGPMVWQAEENHKSLRPHMTQATTTSRGEEPKQSTAQQRIPCQPTRPKPNQTKPNQITHPNQKTASRSRSLPAPVPESQTHREGLGSCSMLDTMPGWGHVPVHVHVHVPPGPGQTTLPWARIHFSHRCPPRTTGRQTHIHAKAPSLISISYCLPLRASTGTATGPLVRSSTQTRFDLSLRSSHADIHYPLQLVLSLTPLSMRQPSWLVRPISIYPSMALSLVPASCYIL